MNSVGAEARGVDFGSATVGPANKSPICQNLTDLSSDDKIREEGEENAREEIILVCPT